MCRKCVYMIQKLNIDNFKWAKVLKIYKVNILIHSVYIYICIYNDKSQIHTEREN